MSQSPDDDMQNSDSHMDGASSGGADAIFEAEPTKGAHVGRDANDAAATAEQRQQMNISNSSRQGNLANEVMKEVHIYELTGRQNQAKESSREAHGPNSFDVVKPQEYYADIARDNEIRELMLSRRFELLREKKDSKLQKATRKKYWGELAHGDS